MPAFMAKVTVEPMVTMLMLSTPAAITRSCVPDITAWAAKWTACWDEPHCRSTVTPGTLSGRPADNQAFLAMSKVCGPICETHPMITSSTAAGVTPVRFTSPRRACAARSTGLTPASDPFRLPTAVRTAPAMNASAITASVRGLRVRPSRLTRCPAVRSRSSRYLVSRPGTECRRLGNGFAAPQVREGGYGRTHLAGVHRGHRGLRMDPPARQDEAERVASELAGGD